MPQFFSPSRKKKKKEEKKKKSSPHNIGRADCGYFLLFW
jgi:hypothetical protein